MLRTLNTTILAFLLAVIICMVMVLFLPLELHNKLLLVVVLIAPIWLAIALWITQKNNMKRVSLALIMGLVITAVLIVLGLYRG